MIKDYILKNFFKLYNIFIFLLILLFIGLNYIYIKEEINYDKNKLQILTNNSKKINQYFLINKTFIFSLKDVLTNNLQLNELSHPAYNQINQKDDTYNILCVLDNIESSLTGIGKLEEIDLDTIHEIYSVLYLKPLFKTILNSKHDIKWVYYTSAKNFIYVAPSSEVWGKEFLTSFYKKEFWTNTIPLNNPKSELILTKIYDDTGKGYLTTLSLPITNRDKFMGVISIDISVNILKEMIDEDILIGSIYLVNKDDKIIASNKKFGLNDVLNSTPNILELSIFDDMLRLVYIEDKSKKIISIIRNSISQVLLLIFILSIIFMLCHLLILNKKIKLLANRDSLTSLLNRRAMRNESKKLLNITNRYNQDTSLLLLDIDFFKKVNDTYGHHIGDITIKEVANILSKNTRTSDLVSRYGGEEFLIMLSNTNSKKAYILAERIRNDISNLKIKNTDLKITISIGCTEYKRDEKLDSFINRVDLLLYKAKDQGRNQTVKG